MYAWKRLRDGEILQTVSASTADDLFEICGFGAVNTEQPIKGFLAVSVRRVNGVLTETHSGQPIEIKPSGPKPTICHKHG